MWVYNHSLVSGVVVGDLDATAVPSAVLRRSLLTGVLHKSNVTPRQLAEITRRHRKRIRVSSAVNQIQTGN